MEHFLTGLDPTRQQSGVSVDPPNALSCRNLKSSLGFCDHCYIGWSSVRQRLTGQPKLPARYLVTGL
jgi:hypothetical protein